MKNVNELTAALATIEKCREIVGCPAGVDLQDHLRQLAAENSGLKRFPEQIVKFVGGLGASEIGSDTKEKIELAATRIKTIATDAYLAGIKADGATAAGDYLKLEAQHMPVVERLMMQDAAEICYGTAARLREGAK